MSRSYDPDNFFQTTDSLVERARKAKKASNKNGHPIRLGGKLLAVTEVPTGDGKKVFVAEAGGTVRGVDLETGNSSQRFLGSSAPITCLTTSQPHSSSTTSSHHYTLYAGSWDKTIYAWPLSPPSSSSTLRFRGHKDFVKCLAFASLTPTFSILISGSADTTIITWDAFSGAKLHTLSGHSMGVLDLALDPATYPLEPGKEGDGVTLFSAGSSTEILRWSIVPTPKEAVSKVAAAAMLDTEPLTPHETSVYAMAFGAGDEPDLWTASADGTVKCLSRDEGWKVNDTIPHGGHVRCVAISPDGKYVVSGGRDEDVKVWDIGSGEMVEKFVGHSDEVIGVLVTRKGKVVSVSLDGTLRTWALGCKADNMEVQSDEPDVEGQGKVDGWEGSRQFATATAAGGELDNDRVQEGRVKDASDDKVPEGQIVDIASMVTAAEAAELDAMMDDDDPMG